VAVETPVTPEEFRRRQVAGGLQVVATISQQTQLSARQSTAAAPNNINGHPIATRRVFYFIKMSGCCTPVRIGLNGHYTPHKFTG